MTRKAAERLSICRSPCFSSMRERILAPVFRFAIPRAAARAFGSLDQARCPCLPPRPPRLEFETVEAAMKGSRLLVLLLLLSAVAPAGLADEPHQHEHGAPPEKLGKVDFAVSCSKAARPQFERAVALLHSFWYDAAEKAFLDVAKADPSCAMAYWGVAMSNFHPIWAAGNPGAEPSPAELRKGIEAVAKANTAGVKTERERA